MSHIAKIEIEINDLEVLRNTCQRLGLEFRENQTSYAWYGVWVGRYPLPDGVSEEQLGKCDHAIRVPGCQYEIGVVKVGQHHVLLWDSWRAGGLEKVLGQQAGRLKQAYAAEKVRLEARKKGYRLLERRTDQGIQLRLTL